MNGGSFHFLISRLHRFRSRKRQKRSSCPNCHGENVELMNQADDREGNWRKEEYFCHDCDCEWDWTYESPFFHWHQKIRPPRWARIE